MTVNQQQTEPHYHGNVFHDHPGGNHYHKHSGLSNRKRHPFFYFWPLFAVLDVVSFAFYASTVSAAQTCSNALVGAFDASGCAKVSLIHGSSAALTLIFTALVILALYIGLKPGTRD